jgi:hypothetical protein
MKTVELYLTQADLLADRVTGALRKRLETGQVRFPSTFVAVERLAQIYCSARDIAEIQRETGAMTQQEDENVRESRRTFVQACLGSLKDGYMTFEDDRGEGALPLFIRIPRP